MPLEDVEEHQDLQGSHLKGLLCFSLCFCHYCTKASFWILISESLVSNVSCSKAKSFEGGNNSRDLLYPKWLSPGNLDWGDRRIKKGQPAKHDGAQLESQHSAALNSRLTCLHMSSRPQETTCRHIEKLVSWTGLSVEHLQTRTSALFVIYNTGGEVS